MGCACAKERQPDEDIGVSDKTRAAVNVKQPTLQRLTTLHPPRLGIGSPKSRSPREKSPRGDYIRRLTEPIESYYRLGEVVMERDGRRLIAVEYLGTGQKCYMTVIPKAEGFTGLQLKATIEADSDRLRRLDHPNILRTLEMLQDDTCYYLVSEPFSGQLSDYFSDPRFREEPFLARIMIQVFAALNYCHRLGIVHSNISPQTILLRDPPCNDSASVKLTGFGEFDSVPSQYADANASFSAPEKSAGYNEKCDIWSCGVVTYLFLSGSAPVIIAGGTQNKGARKRSLLFTESRWSELSKEVLLMLTSMMERNPAQRPSANECLAMPWISLHPRALGVNSNTINRCMNKLKQSYRRNPLQEAVVKFIFTRVLLPRETFQATEAFLSIDKEMDGVISEEELVQGFLSVLPQEEAVATAEQAMRRLSSSEVISYSNFVIACIGEQKLMSAPNLRSIFGCFDRDSSGEVSLSELQAFFNVSRWPEKEKQWRELIQQANRSQDEHFGFEEFATLMRNVNPE